MDKDIIRTLLAFLPLIWLLANLGVLKIQAYRASLGALVIVLPVSYVTFGMKAVHILQASVEGVMLAIHPILWVIISALFVYNITLKTGSMEKIKAMLSGVSQDRRVQALILAFCFGGFLEAVAGFGTAVAIPAGIMISMGFNPMSAATVCLVANTIPVAFGVLGVPVITLAQVTALSADKLSLYTALQLIPFVIFLPLVLTAMVTGTLKGLKGVTLLCLFSGTAFAAGQTLTAMFVGPELAAVIGSLAALVVVLIWNGVLPVKDVWFFEYETSDKKPLGHDIGVMEALGAWAPYILILVLVFATRFIPSLDFLNTEAPFVLKKQFYFGAGGKSLSFSLATGGGTILFISAVIGGFLQGAKVKVIVKTLGATVKMLWKTILTVISIVVLAKLMGYSGMVGAIAAALAAVSGSMFPVISPLIGGLGTFLTGSDTSSNVLFGGLQKQTAGQLGISQEWLTAANASGATAGKMISPQSISIATASTGLSGKEGRILATTLKYCLVYVLLMGLLVYIFSFK